MLQCSNGFSGSMSLIASSASMVLMAPMVAEAAMAMALIALSAPTALMAATAIKLTFGVIGSKSSRGAYVFIGLDGVKWIT